MNGLTRQLFGWGLVVTGTAALISPVRRHRAVWHVTVGDRPTKRRILHGGEYVPTTRVLLDAGRSGNRRPDADFRFALGLALIGFGLALSLVAAES